MRLDDYLNRELSNEEKNALNERVKSLQSFLKENEFFDVDAHNMFYNPTTGVITLFDLQKRNNN